MSFLLGALGVLVVFGVVIFVHEFGHFIVAKKSGVKVERFSFGLGPEAVGFQWGETRYCIAWLPLGGEVRMSGEEASAPEDSTATDGAPAAPEEPVDPARQFQNQSWVKRSAIVLAGPAMNYVLAFAVFAHVAFWWGDPKPSPEPLVGDVIAGYPAEAAGLRSGDRVLTVSGQAVSSWKELAEAIHARPAQEVDLVYVPAGPESGERTVRLTPRKDPSSGAGLIGIGPATVYEKVSFGESLHRGAAQCVGWSWFTLSYLGDKIAKREKPDLAGPVGIATVVAKATKSGPREFLFLIALISVGIGLFNLFPIPLLDGGHLMFFVWEGITRRRVTPKAVARANMVGMTLLLGILVFATFSDFQRMRPPKQGPGAGSQGSAETTQP
jgi:regulator of sigma E protease